MILGNAMIRKCLDDGTIKAYHVDHETYTEQRLSSADLHINPNSVDVTLAPVFVSWHSTRSIVDPYDPSSIRVDRVETHNDAPFILQPGACVLGCTRERFVCSDITINQVTYSIVQEYIGRSTIGRLFLCTHVAAGFGDVGFESVWTLELVNLSKYPIALHPGMRIGQIYFTCVLGCETPYNGAYTQQQHGPLAPALGTGRFQ